MILEYNGTDITEYVSIRRCWHEMNAQGKADTLIIQFDDQEAMWDEWNPQAGDEVAVINSKLSTGAMFVHRKMMRGRYYTLVAASVPLSVNVIRSKTWQDVRLRQIGREIADIHGLKFKTYGIDNTLYSYLLQKGETDFSFLDRLCALEGCAFLVHDKTLVIYSIEHIEQRNPVDEILLDDAAKYQLYDNGGRLYGSCKIIKGAYRGVCEAENGSDRVYLPNLAFDVSSPLEAIRFSKNLLIHQNNKLYDGHFYTAANEDYTPAAVLDMQIERYRSWEGKMYITKVRNDYIADKSKVFFRRIMEGQYD